VRRDWLGDGCRCVICAIAQREGGSVALEMQQQYRVLSAECRGKANTNTLNCKDSKENAEGWVKGFMGVISGYQLTVNGCKATDLRCSFGGDGGVRKTKLNAIPQGGFAQAQRDSETV
jgi:hypothetical protein